MNRSGLWSVIGLLIAGAAAGIFGMRLLHPSAPGLSSPPSVPAPIMPAGLPPLENSDGFVREKAARLSSDPAFRDWLESDDLVSRFVAAINITAHGKVPRELLAQFAPRGEFRVVRKGGRVFLDPAGYSRYDRIATFAASVNAAEAAKVFELLLPLFDAAQRALGEPNPDAREALFAAVRELLAAPVLQGEVELKAAKNGLGWAYADDRLERLSPAQKQLMRLGPENKTVVSDKLNEVSTALGAKPWD
jgi:hypothetical protein